MTAPDPTPDDSLDITLPPRPYPGLRPFRKSEWPIFFGREPMTDDVIQQLIAKRFVMVHGDSGCGKSSLLKAGVFSRLEQQNVRGGLAWRTCSFEPGRDPLGRLAQSLSDLKAGGPAPPDVTLDIRRALNLGGHAPEAIARMLLRDERDHLCILADQFEELFAFVRASGRREEASLLVQLLVGILEKPPRGLYAVATMRSEFLGECAQFTGFAEAVNRSPYLVPRMAHSDLIRAIREPATLYDGQVSLDLAERLIADAGAGQDELPLIQNGLMLLHRAKLPAAAMSAWRLETSDYKAANLTLLLSNYADSLVAKDQEPVVESVFRALAQINAEGRAIRRPQTFKTLCDVSGASAETLNRVLLPFRQEGASLLRPYGDTPLVDSDEVSITHEALIRCWKKIADRSSGWLHREFRDRLIWQALEVQARSFQADPSNVLSPTTAQDRATWLKGKSQAWAELNRSDTWPLVQALVQESVAVAQRAREKEARRRRRVVSSAIVLAVVFAGLAVWIFTVSLGRRRALDTANDATAKSLWSRLDFVSGPELTDDELRALWEIANAHPDVRREFVNKLMEKQNVTNMSRRPDAVVRAIGLQWPEAQRAAIWDAVLTALENAKSDLDPQALLAVSRELPGRPSLAQQQRQVDAFRMALQPGSKTDVAQALRRFSAGRPRPEDCTPAIDAIIDALIANPPRDLTGQFRFLPGLPSAGKAEQAFRELGPRLIADAEADKDTSAQVEALRAVAARVPKERVRELAPLVKLLTKPPRPHASELVVDVLLSSDAWSSDEGRTIVAPALEPLVKAKSIDEIFAFAPVLQLAPGALTDAQAQNVLTKLVRSMSPGGSERVSLTIHRIAGQLPQSQRSLLRETLLKSVTATTDPKRLEQIATALRVVPGAADRADQLALDVAVRELQKPGSATRLRAAAYVVGAVSSTPSPIQEEAIVNTLVAELSRVTDPFDKQVVANAFESVAAKLGSSQAVASLAALLSEASRASEREEIRALAAAIAAMAKQPPPPEVRAALDRAVDLLVEPITGDYDQSDRLDAVSSLTRALLARTDDDHAKRSVARLVKALGETGDANQLAAVISALAGSSALLSPEQRKIVKPQAQALLAWSRSTKASAAGIRVFAELSAADSEKAQKEEREKKLVEELAEVLKYPNVRAGEVLGALKQYAQDAPPPDAGLEEALTWIGRKYTGVLVQPVTPVPYRALGSAAVIQRQLPY